MLDSVHRRQAALAARDNMCIFLSGNLLCSLPPLFVASFATRVCHPRLSLAFVTGVYYPCLSPVPGDRQRTAQLLMPCMGWPDSANY